MNLVFGFSRNLNLVTASFVSDESFVRLATPLIFC